MISHSAIKRRFFVAQSHTPTLSGAQARRGKKPLAYLLPLVAVLIAVFGAAQWQVNSQVAVDWPDPWARWTIRILKAEGLEMEDPRWMHLHRGHHTAAESETVRLRVEIIGASNYEILEPAQSGIEIRYTVHGVPVSGWLASPFTYTLSIDNPALDTLADGFHDLSLEARGVARNDFKPHPVFVHMTRGRPLGTLVPIIAGDDQGAGPAPEGPGVVYVDPANRRMTGYPMNATVNAWHNAPYQEDLYLELMAPHSELFASAQMWWEDPPHPGVPFARGLPPKHGEDHRSLRIDNLQERLPFKDGPRGVGWMSPYVTGQIDSRGRFAFAEVGGRVGWLLPDGEVITVAGWRVKPDKDPTWYLKPLDVVRRNMELRGQWVEGKYAGEAGGFRTPLDVAIDPQNENIFYVVGYEDHCVWKIEITDARTNDVRVSVFAGSLNHTPGFQDGAGHLARFNGPASCVWDPTSDALYVADQDNDAIRKITRDGRVTTLFGSPGMANRLQSRGLADVFNQSANRAASRFEVTAPEAAGGSKPDIYTPQCIRVDSHGNIVLLELGYGAIRRINPATGETKKLGEVGQKFAEFDRGWAWLDVDRWGNAGPLDGIYWCKFVGGEVDGEQGDRFNEVYAWLPPEGGLSRFIFGDDWEPHPDGWGLSGNADPPHYPWLVAVDPRGALLVAGGGEHGLSRLRKRQSTDPVASDYYPRYYEGQLLWARGGGPGANSFSFKFGWGAHNYLGLADAWALRGNETDQQLLDMFEATAEIRNNATARDQWLYFVRKNLGPPGAPRTNQPPAVGINSPASGASFIAPAAVAITAQASDADGSVSKVEFFNGGTKLGEDATSPYSFVWNNVVAGDYMLTARATDNFGITTSSSPVRVAVNPAALAPVLLSEATSTRAIALDSAVWLREPFALTSPNYFSFDRRTRIMLFALNVNLLPGETASAVTVEAEDAGGRLYQLQVEYVGTVPGYDWLGCVVVRLSDNLGEVGDVLLRLNLRGVSSNRVRVGIGSVGGGPPNNSGSAPTLVP
jgi:hypothetical protein